MKTIALIEKGADGKYGIYTPDTDCTIVGEGATIAEAKADFEEGAKEMILSYTENGQPLPKELQNITFEYKYDLSTFFAYFPINISKFAKQAHINVSLMHQYKNGQYISQKQMQKIQDAIQAMGKEMAECQLC